MKSKRPKIPPAADKAAKKKIPSVGKAVTSEAVLERRRDGFRKILADNKLSPAGVAKMAGLSTANQIYNFLKGRSKALSTDTLERIAAVIPNVTTGELMGEPATKPKYQASRVITVRSKAVVGAYRPSFDVPLAEQLELAVPIQPGQIAQGAFGVIVGLPGAEQLYPEHTLLVCLPMRSYEGSLTTKRRIILQRILHDNVEVTVRELEVRGGDAFLLTRSTHPEHQAPVKAPWPNHGQMWKLGDDRFSIAAIVIGAYSWEE